MRKFNYPLRLHFSPNFELPLRTRLYPRSDRNFKEKQEIEDLIRLLRIELEKLRNEFGEFGKEIFEPWNPNLGSEAHNNGVGTNPG